MSSRINPKKLSEMIGRLSNGNRAALARKLELKPGRLGSYERGEVENPSTAVLTLLAEHQGMSLDALLVELSDDTPSLRCKEKIAGYTVGEVESYLDDLPLKEQVILALRILDRAKDAIA